MCPRTSRGLPTQERRQTGSPPGGLETNSARQVSPSIRPYMSFHLVAWSFGQEVGKNYTVRIYELSVAAAAHEFLKRIVDFIHNRQPSPPAFTLPQTPEKHKGGDLFETRQEADQETEDPAGTGRARSGELAYRKAKAGRGAGHPPQAHEHHPGHPGTGPVKTKQEGAAE